MCPRCVSTGALCQCCWCATARGDVQLCMCSEQLQRRRPAASWVWGCMAGWVHITLWLLRVTTLQFEQIRRYCHHHGSGLSHANLTLQSLTQGSSGHTDAADPFQGHKGGSVMQPGLPKRTCTQTQSLPKELPASCVSPGHTSNATGTNKCMALQPRTPACTQCRRSRSTHNTLWGNWQEEGAEALPWAVPRRCRLNAT